MTEENTTPERVYGRTFWLTYVANTCLVVANSLLFRYADFVDHLGGGELMLGWIVGVGAVGSLTMRLVQGLAIDAYGPRRVWTISIACLSVAIAAHVALLLAPGAGFAVAFPLRVLFNTSLAGAFGAQLTFLTLFAPPGRTAEVLASLGSSGFVGMMIGPFLGDWIFAAGGARDRSLTLLFSAAAGFSAIALVAAWFAASRLQLSAPPRRRPAMNLVLLRYFPTPALIAAVVMGVGLALPQTFVRTHAASLGIERIGPFFAVYAPTAFVARLAAFRLPTLVGTRPLILAGFGVLTAGVFALQFAQSIAGLMVPAALLGTAHALLFPMVMAEGATAFPVRYRGLGTTLMLGAFDAGVMVSSPLIGLILDRAAAWGLAPYPAMFTAVSLVIAAGLVAYLAGAARAAKTALVSPATVVRGSAAAAIDPAPLAPVAVPFATAEEGTADEPVCCKA